MKSSVAAEAEARQGRKKQSFPLPSQSLEKNDDCGSWFLLLRFRLRAQKSYGRRREGKGEKARGEKTGVTLLSRMQKSPSFPTSLLLPFMHLANTSFPLPHPVSLNFADSTGNSPATKAREKFVETLLKIAPNFLLPAREERVISDDCPMTGEEFFSPQLRQAAQEGIARSPFLAGNPPPVYLPPPKANRP